MTVAAGVLKLANRLLGEDTILTYKEILQWDKDLQTLIRALGAWSPDDNEEAARKEHDTISKALKNYVINLENDLARRFNTAVVRFKDAPVADIRSKITKAFITLKDGINYLLQGIKPSTTLSYVGYEFNAQLYLERARIEGEIARPAEKLWDLMRKYVKFMAGDDKARQAKTNQDAPETASYMGLTFVNDVQYPDEDLQAMFGHMAHPLTLLKRIMPEVFYGQIHMKVRGPDQSNLKVGHMTIDAAGTYSPHGDTVTLYADSLKNWMAYASSVIVHELAHRYYFKVMTQADRGRWEHFFADLKTQAASDYGNQNPEEDFAEAILHYVMEKGVMARKDVRDRVEAMLKRRLRDAKENKSAKLLRLCKGLVENDIDQAVPDAGLEVEKKRKVAGLLKPSDGWTVLREYDSEDPHGNPIYAECANCKKTIRYVVIISGEGQEHEVGADCALTLVKGEDFVKVKAFVTKRQATVKATRTVLDYIEQELAKPFAHDERLRDLIDNFNAASSHPNAKYKVDFSYKMLLNPNAAMNVAAFTKDKQSNDKNLIMAFAHRSIMHTLLKEHRDELVKAIKTAADQGKGLKDKATYFLMDPTKKGSGTDFFDDFPHLITDIGTAEKIAGPNAPTYLAWPKA